MKPLPNRLIFFIGLAMVCIVALVLYMRAQSTPLEGEQKVIDEITYEYADTPEKQARGLSGRSEIPHRYVMIFIFPTPGRYGFWMKDMLVPIDIVWLDATGEITKIDENVEPSSFPTLYYPPAPTHLVIETRAGEARALGWDIGTTITLPHRE